MAERLFGTETEYAFTALDAHGGAIAPSGESHPLLRLARTTLVHAAGAGSSGLFLENGSRFYLDCGYHPELSTPECTNPWDGVRYLLAGDRILADLAAGLVAERSRIAEVVLSRCNVDYGTRATWGCHESYLTTMPVEEIAPQILPHLVSRLVFTGAGGFNNRSNGLAFTLSPRVPHLLDPISSDSTGHRGIVHTKNEPLCHGYARLHLICGESLCSQTAAWLKLGTTALVVALIEAGLRPGDGVQLLNSVAAMQAFAADPSCRAVAPSAEGQQLTAIAIQRHYLHLVEAHVNDTFMPPWAEEVCERWRATLDLLEAAPDAVTTTLDWALKLHLFRSHAERRGIAWQTLPHWTAIIDRLKRALQRSGHPAGGVPPAVILGPRSPIADTVARLAPVLRKHGLSWDGLQPYVDLKRELFEIDVRFSQLGPRGIFATLDRGGALTHHVPGVDDIEGATIEPPAGGRARLRGEAIRALARRGVSRRAQWHAVWNMKERKRLDLTDPFASTPRWIEAPPEEPPPPEALHDLLARVRGRVRRTLRVPPDP